MTLPTRFGSEFLVSANPGTQTLSSVARLDNGQMVVVWTEGAGVNADIKFRLLNADGTAAGDIQTANVATNGNQTNAKVAALAGGKFAIVWEDYSADASGNAAYRVFNADGSSSMLADKTVYDGSTQSNTLLQQEVQIAGRPDGSFLIGWWDSNTANSGLTSSSAAMVRAFDNNGVGVGSAIRISGNFGGDFAPVIATSGNDVAFVWDDDGGPTQTQIAEDGIYFRTITGALPTTNFTDGGALANNGVFRESVRLPDAAYTNLGLVSVWQDTRTNITVGADIYARLANGTVVQVNTTVGGDQVKPAVAGLVGGGFVVVWTDVNGTGGGDIRARYFEPDGLARDLDFIVTQASFSGSVESDVDVAGLLDGRFVVTWGSSSRPSRGTEGMIFDPRTVAVTWFGTDELGAPAGISEQYWGTNIIASGDYLYGGFGNDTIYGQAGADTLFGGPGSDRVDGGDGNDTLYSDTAINDNDLVYSGNDTVLGGNGDDTLIGGFDINTMDGGAGVDTVDYNLEYSIALEPGFLSYQASLEASLVTGQATVVMSGLDAFGDPFDFAVVTDTFSNIENVVGTFGNDSIVGSAGANILSGKSGADTLDGGLGQDKSLYNSLPGAYTINRNGLTTTVNGPDGTDTLTSVEFLQFSDLSIRTLEHAERDFGNDGKSDILWRNTNGSVLAWNMNGTTIASSPLLAGVSADWKIADGSGDYNGDSNSDILWRNDNGDVVSWHMNGSAITSGQFIGSAGLDWKIADGAGDYNADGKSDVLWRNDNGNVVTWLMDGGAIAGSAFVGAVTIDWKVSDGSGDYNGDGKSDILWRNDTGGVVIWLMDGPMIANATFVASVPIDWKIADGSGDYNGDGKSDVLWRNDNGNVLIWTMNGGAIASSPFVASVPVDWKIADGSSDYNGDGKSDVLWRNDNGTVLTWTMDGATINSAATIVSVQADWNIQA